MRHMQMNLMRYGKHCSEENLLVKMIHLETGKLKLSTHPNTMRKYYKTKLNLKQTEGTSKMKKQEQKHNGKIVKQADASKSRYNFDLQLK